MAKRGCGAPSAGKHWTITSMEKARINSRCSERTVRSSSRKYSGNMFLATPKWTGRFSFAWTIYLNDYYRPRDRPCSGGLQPGKRATPSAPDLSLGGSSGLLVHPEPPTEAGLSPFLWEVAASAATFACKAGRLLPQHAPTSAIAF